jgi:hypothetical protein
MRRCITKISRYSNPSAGPCIVVWAANPDYNLYSGGGFPLRRSVLMTGSFLHESSPGKPGNNEGNNNDPTFLLRSSP